VKGKPRGAIAQDNVLAVLAEFGALREPTAYVRPVRKAPWFRTTPINPEIHGGRIGTRLLADGREDRDERRWRALPEPPPSDAPTFGEMLMFDRPHPG
jgi:hypothetical protein